jgi:capsular polysaccharide export protein
MNKPISKQTFLLLQGVATPFFPELGKALISKGHTVLKVNFCGGDLLTGRFFSNTLTNINYRGGLKGLDAFYVSLFDEHNITDIVLFGDTRPLHSPAVKIAKENNITVHVYEEGYFRPNWITLDTGGVNAYSSLSKDPIFYEKYINKKYKTANKGGGGLIIRAWHDIRYHAATLVLKSQFPHYQSHRPERASKEYWGWIKRLPSLFLYYNDQSKQKINKLIKSQIPFYLLPLQLDGDSQMRIHSPINTVSELIQTTLKSFSTHAPQDSVLVIKNHPLDPWFVNYPKLINKLATQYGIAKGRIIYLESGDLNKLLLYAKGTVLVNSTVGTSALQAECPVIALGSAIYDMAGLTFQGSLDQFWTEASPPDKALFSNFKAAVIQQTQINGAFYNQKGIEMAVQGSLSKLTNRLS